MIKPWVAHLVFWAFVLGLPGIPAAILLSPWLPRTRAVWIAMVGLWSLLWVLASHADHPVAFLLFTVVSLLIYPWLVLVKRINFVTAILILPLLSVLPILAIVGALCIFYFGLIAGSSPQLPVHEQRLSANLVCRSYSIVRHSGVSTRLLLLRENPFSWKDEFIDYADTFEYPPCASCELSSGNTVLLQTGCQFPTVVKRIPLKMPTL